MSTNIAWKPLTSQNNFFEGGTSEEYSKLTKIFGRTLTKEHIFTIRALAVATDYAFYDEVADVVEKYGPIIIYEEC